MLDSKITTKARADGKAVTMRSSMPVGDGASCIGITVPCRMPMTRCAPVRDQEFRNLQRQYDMMRKENDTLKKQIS
jgi:hypothetical protein